MDWEDVSLVTRSQRREEVLKCLYEEPKMPSTIRDQTGRYFSEVSESLTELVEAELAIRLNEDQKGRYYKITKQGSEIVEYIQSEDD
jgi:predicted transcriptional regulator